MSKPLAKIDELSKQFLWTADETASVLRVTVDTVDYLHRTLQLRAVKVGKRRFWRPDDVRSFVKELGRDDA